MQEPATLRARFDPTLSDGSHLTFTNHVFGRGSSGLACDGLTHYKEAAGGAEEVSPFRTQGVELLFPGGQFIGFHRPSFSDEVTNEVYEAVAVRARLKTCIDDWKRAELRNAEPCSAKAWYQCLRKARMSAVCFPRLSDLRHALRLR